MTPAAPVGPPAPPGDRTGSRPSARHPPPLAQPSGGSPGAFVLWAGAAAAAAWAVLLVARPRLAEAWSAEPRAALAAPNALPVLAAVAILTTAAIRWRARPWRPGPAETNLAAIGLFLGAPLAWMASGSLASLLVGITAGTYVFAAGASLVGLLAYFAWAAWFATRLPRAVSGTTMATTAGPAPFVPAAATTGPVPLERMAFDDRPLKVTLIVGGILVALLAVPVIALATFGLCYSGCSGDEEWKAALPYVLALVPLGYAAGSWQLLRARTQRAARDPAWAARNSGAGGGIAIGIALMVAGAAALVAGCFGLMFAAA